MRRSFFARGLSERLLLTEHCNREERDALHVHGNVERIDESSNTR
jgi:hypothetical protein